MRVHLLFLLILVVTMANCTPVPKPAPVPGATVTVEGLVLSAGYEAQIVVDGLEGPTQMIKGPNGRLWVAHLAGGENDGVGEVLAIDLDSGERRVVADGLLKPTGIAVLGGYLWVAAKRDLLRFPLDELGNSGPAETVLAGLPFNGRSNSTLTVTPRGELLFATSGARFGGTPLDRSATLWRISIGRPAEPEALAFGLKNAYAHAFDRTGRLWVTEIADDPVNGRTPPDELNSIDEGGDFGWPKCYGYHEPALNYGGTTAHCMTTQPAAMVFPPRSTPTGIVASPWEPETLLVAFWLQGIVAQVRVSGADGGATGSPETFIAGMRNPQDILVWNEDTILVSDHTTGVVYAIRPTTAGKESESL